MADPKDSRPQSMWPRPPPKEAPPQRAAERPAGRIKHDDRGNAVWDWLKETSRIFIGNTSALLKKLESSELKMEDDKDQELRLEGDKDSAGGYDPYNQRTPVKKPPGKK
jgi:hypothetical protein